MNSADSFSASYDQARAKFLDAAKAADGALERIAHPERGPDGKDLSTDVAWWGPRDAERVLVMISGTHGVEGYCGSGAQVDWLRRGEIANVPAGTGVLMIHAINPYGFAWDRRVTEDNVDLNRNWIDFAKPLPENRDYAALSAAICPPDWSDEAQQRTLGELMKFVGARGMPAFQQAVSGGQYAHPKGIFFGGAGPTWSRRTQTSIFKSYLAKAAKIAIVDYHTGLGPWGYAEQIVPLARESDVFKRARDWFGAAITSPVSGTSTSADVMGDGMSAAVDLLRHAELTGVALEVGTKPVMDVLNALRADAWLHAHGDPLSPAGRAIKKQIRAAFYGDADDWKGMVAGQSLLTCRQALAGLQGERAHLASPTNSRHEAAMITGPTSHSFISQRLRLRYVDWGNPEAPPLILLHGGRDHSRSWDWTAQELRRDWHVIAPDLRGHGDSDWSPSGDYGGMANLYDLAQLIHQLKLAPVTIVAHSYGGNIALRYAGVYPANVRKLVAIEGLGPSPKMLAERFNKPIDERLRGWIEAKRGIAGRTPRRYATLDEAFKRMKEENHHLSDEQARHLTNHGISQNEDGTYTWKFDPYMRVFPPFDMAQDDVEALWAAITCPTLLMYGEDSWASNPEKDGRAKHFKTARVIMFKNAGHWVHHDRFDLFMAELRAFL